MMEKRFRKYLSEGYEGKIIAICKEAGIDCSFKNGKLYVDKGDVADAKKAIKADDDIIKLPEIIGESKISEDSVDMEKHNTLNDIFQALEQLNTEVDELDALDSDMDSTGAGDLHDQLTTFKKHIGALYQVLDRAGRIVPMDALDKADAIYRGKISDSVNEEVDSELMDEVIIQIKRDCDMGDYTAIEELLMSCPEDKLRGFLSEVEESVNEEVIRIRAVKEKADLKLPTTGINRKFDGPNAKEHAAKAKQQFEKDGYHVVYETNSKDLDYLKKLAGI